MSSSASYLESRGFKAFQLCSLLIDLSVSRTLLAILSGLVALRIPPGHPLLPFAA